MDKSTIEKNAIDAIKNDPEYKRATEISRMHAAAHTRVMETNDFIEFYGSNHGNNDLYGIYFSNCVKAPIVIDGVTYASSEHYFQITKFTVDEETTRKFAIGLDIGLDEQLRRNRDNIAAMHVLSPEDVARHGRSCRMCPIRPDWDTARVHVMYRALVEKFKDGEFQKVLADSYNKVLIERAPRDDYWAINHEGRGENMLGILLMYIRELARVPVSS